MEKIVAEYIFKLLQKRIGSEVSCVSWCCGKSILVEGTLKDVEPFYHVNIDGNIIPFVGEYQAIEEIKLKNETMQLYSNPSAKGYYIKSPAQLMSKQEQMLGYSIAKQEAEETKKRQAERLAKKKKLLELNEQLLIERGTLEIVPKEKKLQR